MDVQKTRESRSKHVVIFTKFCQAKKVHSNSLFCFYEGEDVKYYGSRVERITGFSHDKIVSYNCGGKAGVLKVNQLIKRKQEYDYIKKAYFIDKDFCSLESLDDNIYQTSGYSVENNYTSITAFARILNYAFGISCTDIDYEMCMKDYESRMNEFHNYILVLNAWIRTHRQREYITGKRELDLGEFKIAKYFKSIGINEIVIKQEITKDLLEKCFPDICCVDNHEIENSIEELMKTDMQQTFRGKYELEFLRKIIDDLRMKNKKDEYFHEKLECIKIDPNGDPLLVLSSCADTDDSLVIFLQRYVI